MGSMDKWKWRMGRLHAYNYKHNNNINNDFADNFNVYDYKCSSYSWKKKTSSQDNNDRLHNIKRKACAAGSRQYAQLRCNWILI
jgi:hypothetical protein